MFRTTLLYGVSVLLAIAILIVSLFAVTYRSVHAAASPVATATATVSPTPAVIDYPFPYPGVLPDSPLWVFKAVRDRVILWLTFDKIANTEKLLFYSDKRLEAARVLIEGGKADIGITTSVKAEKYLSDAVNQLLLAKKEGGNIDLLEARMKKSTVAHLQVLTRLQERSPEIFAALKEAISINRSASSLLP